MTATRDELGEHQLRLEQDGFTLVRSVYDARALGEIAQVLQSKFAGRNESVRQRNGEPYAARNVLELCPEIINLWRTPKIVDWLTDLLGDSAGLVRGLYFDKPPEQTWALPWHKDRLIAVRDQVIDAAGYSRPRLRMGVPHSEPPVEVLESMLTLRIHLDDVTDENGPLQVLPGSHRTGKDLRIEEFKPTVITCQAGDILAMRPLLAHCSGSSAPECRRHRRILHLEFSGMSTLPGDVQWWSFYPVHHPSDSSN